MPVVSRQLSKLTQLKVRTPQTQLLGYLSLEKPYQALRRMSTTSEHNKTTYARPASALEWQTISPRLLRPLETPPTMPPTPKLPSPSRNLEFTSTHTLTTHIIPAAFPRSPSIPIPGFPQRQSANETKEARLKRASETTNALLETKKQLQWGEVDNLPLNKTLLWLAVNRYARKEKAAGRQGVTLVMAHANGMHKEVGP